MKHRLLTLVAACIAAVAAWAQAEITFDDMRRDMGVIKAADGKVTVEYTFTNTGSAPLAIVTAFGSCDCAKIKFPSKPIEPGKTGAITVVYNPKNKSGEVMATITVVSNDPKRKRSKLLLKGVVVPKNKKK